MPIPGSLAEQIGQKLSDHLGVHVEVEQSTGVGGGSINDAWRIDTNEGRFFLKTNSADRHPSMFEAEADGLHRLRSTGTVAVPEVIGHGEDHDTSWLLLEWIESSTTVKADHTGFGIGLARLHRNTADRSGLDRSNYIGTLVQRNDPHEEWVPFMIHQRLEPLVKMARDNRRVEAGIAFRFERLYPRLEELFPKEEPALLHGDLWSGNHLAGTDGRIWIFDPAVYYGHREMDLAMMQLFGGFDPKVIEAYDREYPLEKGWQERVDLCNLYPLLVHVNLFGGNYVKQVETILKRFV